MMRRAVEWFAGSILVYVVVAACAGSEGTDLVAVATGGLQALVGGSASSSGGLSTGTGATGEGATGSILNPVPDADAAEDGTRIVNIYRTTPDGLRSPSGFWDKELQVQCNFVRTEDGKDRCVPSIGMFGAAGSYFADAACTIPVAYSTKGNCFEYALQVTQATTCGIGPSYTIYKPATKVSAAYQKSAETCVALPESSLGNMDIYTVTEVPPSQFAEGELVHD